MSVSNLVIKITDALKPVLVKIIPTGVFKPGKESIYESQYNEVKRCKDRTL